MLDAGVAKFWTRGDCRRQARVRFAKEQLYVPSWPLENLGQLSQDVCLLRTPTLPGNGKKHPCRQLISLRKPPIVVVD